MSLVKLSKIYKKLRLSVLDEKGNPIGVNKFADKIHLPASRISELENGKREMSLTELKVYHSFFNVSFEYLLGETGYKTTDEELAVACKYTGLSEEAVERLKIITEQCDEVDRGKIVSELILDWDFAYLSTLLYKYICADGKRICKFGVGLDHLAIHQDKLIESQITNTMLGIAQKLKVRLESDFESAKKLHQIASERYGNIMTKSKIQRLAAGEITNEEYDNLIFEYSKENWDYNPHSYKYDEILKELCEEASDNAKHNPKKE